MKLPSLRDINTFLRSFYGGPEVATFNTTGDPVLLTLTPEQRERMKDYEIMREMVQNEREWRNYREQRRAEQDRRR